MYPSKLGTWTQCLLNVGQTLHHRVNVSTRFPGYMLREKNRIDTGCVHVVVILVLMRSLDFAS